MDPRSWAQDVLRCHLCETPGPIMYCDICQIHMCKACVGEHLSDLSNEHKVVPFEKLGSTTKCPEHFPKICELYCERCDIPICIQCASSKEHKGHEFIDIKSNENTLLGYLKELQEFIYPRYLAITSNIRVQKVDLKTNSNTLTTAIEKQAKDLHKEIDNIANKLKSDLAEVDATNLDMLNKHEDEITRKTFEIIQSIADLNKLVYSSDISIVIAYKSKITEFKKMLHNFQVSLPSFTPHAINRELIAQQFGSLSAVSIKTEDHGYTMDSPCVRCSSSEKSLIDVPQIIANIETAYGFFNPICGMSTVNDKDMWTFGWDNIIRLYNLQGKLVKSIQTESGNRPTDIAVTSREDLVYTDPSDSTVNMVKNTQIQTIIRQQSWKPRGVYGTSSGDLLIAMVSDDGKEAKVVRYSERSTERQSIQYDDKGRPLYSPHGLLSFDFTFNNIKYLSENRNQDICVSDRGAGAVVVVNKAGKHRFTYNGAPSATTGLFRLPFDPFGIATDSQSRILTTDCNNHCIHILDRNGVFLKFIDNCHLQWPCGICVDISDNIFVAELRKGKIKKIQYYT